MRFSHRTTVSTPKLASFWQEKHGMAIILVQGFAKTLSCQDKSRTWYQFWHFSISKKVQLPAIKINEQPIQLSKSKINHLGYNFS